MATFQAQFFPLATIITAPPPLCQKFYPRSPSHVTSGIPRLFLCVLCGKSMIGLNFVVHFFSSGFPVMQNDITNACLFTYNQITGADYLTAFSAPRFNLPPGSGDLSEPSGDLSPRPGDLSESGGDLSAGLGDLSPGPAEFSGRGGDLSPRSAELSASLGELSARSGDLSAGSADLSPGWIYLCERLPIGWERLPS